MKLPIKSRIQNFLIETIAHIFYLFLEYKGEIMKTVLLLIICLSGIMFARNIKNTIETKLHRQESRLDSLDKEKAIQIQNAYVAGYKMAIENNCKALRIEADTVELNKEQFLLLIANMESYKQRKEKRIIYIKWGGK